MQTCPFTWVARVLIMDAALRRHRRPKLTCFNQTAERVPEVFRTGGPGWAFLREPSDVDGRWPNMWTDNHT